MTRRTLLEVPAVALAIPLTCLAKAFSPSAKLGETVVCVDVMAKRERDLLFQRSAPSTETWKQDSDLAYLLRKLQKWPGKMIGRRV